ncbi:MAG: 4'-phosphopantetheinyl transferase superfamily protein [Bacteroidia bacterium]|nr:4'-phosphopantetheinyl transferase superfamily protein [Bacteroidia bacterium]
MGLFWEELSDDYRWGVWKVDESIEELLSITSSTAYYERGLTQFSSEKRRLEWLAVRVLLTQLCGEEKEVGYRPSGKPYLVDGSFQISISHTKGYVAVILSEKFQVGIDIEQFRDRVHRVADRFMRTDEQAQPYQGVSTWSLLLHWSAKETLYKCVEGAQSDLTQLRLLPFVLSDQGTFQANEYWSAHEKAYTLAYRLHTDFVLTWMVDR